MGHDTLITVGHLPYGTDKVPVNMDINAPPLPSPGFTRLRSVRDEYDDRWMVLPT